MDIITFIVYGIGMAIVLISVISLITLVITSILFLILKKGFKKDYKFGSIFILTFISIIIILTILKIVIPNKVEVCVTINGIEECKEEKVWIWSKIPIYSINPGDINVTAYVDENGTLNTETKGELAPLYDSSISELNCDNETGICSGTLTIVGPEISFIIK